MKGFDARSVVAAAELDQPNDLFGVINDERVRQFLAAARVCEEIFTAPGDRPLRSDFIQPQPDRSNSQIVCRLRRML